MCGLCGLWGESAHWTSTAAARAQGGGSLLPLRARAQQLACIVRIAAGAGVTVRDWGGSTWIVSNASGASEIVGSLPEVWRAAETLSGRRIDPLQADTATPGEPRCR